MPHATGTVVIIRPPAEVFAFLADPTNDPLWRPAVESIAHRSGAGRGARYEQKLKGPGGRTVRADIEITERDPNWRVAFRTLSGPVRPTGSYELRPEGAGTSVTMSLDAPLGGLKKVLLSRPVQRSMEAEVGSLVRLKRHLEVRGTVDR